MKIFLDSGAFSAFHNNTSVNIQEYIDFIKENKSSIETYANLDEIGSPEGTWKNQEEMERQGLNPIPVYHLGEPHSYLDRCMKYPYFAVGGIASKLTSQKALSDYLSTLFRKVCPKSNDFYPICKVHGFGIATPTLLITYPWYSADTTSWVQYGRYGIVLVPRKINGQMRYDVSPYTVAISSRSKAVGDAEHFNNMAKEIQDEIKSYFDRIGCPIGKIMHRLVDMDYKLQEDEKWVDKKNPVKIGPDKIEDAKNKTPVIQKLRVEKIMEKGLCCDGDMRDKVNLQYFLDLEKHQGKYPRRWPWEEGIKSLPF